MVQGTAKRFKADKGFGVIASVDGPDLFVRLLGMAADGHRSLSENHHAE